MNRNKIKIRSFGKKKISACEHKNTYVEQYLNPCSSAGCSFNGPFTYHLNCGTQSREVCSDCGAIVHDSADDEIEYREEEYLCAQCESSGEITPGHKYCGETFYIPVG